MMSAGPRAEADTVPFLARTPTPKPLVHTQRCRLVKVAWAAPCSVVGLLLGGLVILFGGSVRRIDGTLEFAYRQSLAQCGTYSRKLPYRAITFGHVIVAVTEAELWQVPST